MDQARLKSAPYWMSDYAVSFNGEQAPSRCETTVVVKRAPSLEGRVDKPNFKLRKKFRDSEATSFTVRTHFSWRAKSITYMPTAFISEPDQVKWNRDCRLYRQTIPLKEVALYEGTPLYKNVKKAMDQIRADGNDNFLTGRLEVARSPGKGLGVFALKTIKPNSLISFYGSQIRYISQKDIDDFSSNHYLFALPIDDWYADGESFRSLAGMVNHSKDPNVFAYVFEETGSPTQIAYVTTKVIKVGEELFINYDDTRKVPLFFKATGETAK